MRKPTIINKKPTRREFVKVGIGTLLYSATQNGDFNFSPAKTGRDPHYNLQVLSKFTIPRNIQQVRLDDIVQAFSGHGNIGSGLYVPQFVDLVQSIHHSLTGTSYPEQVQRNYDTSDIIEVMIVEGLSGHNPTQQIFGKFVSANQTVKRNILYLDSQLRYPNLIGMMFHELAHGTNGRSELLAYSTGHREFSQTIANYPSLLMEKDSDCPLMNELHFYFGVLTPPGSVVPVVPNLSSLPYLFLLDGSAVLHGRAIPKINLENAVQLSGLGSQVEGVYSNAANTAVAQYNFDKVVGVMKRFVDATEEYIVANSPHMSNTQRQLLTKKIERARNFQF